MARIPIHPGEVLAEDLEALDMSAAKLARLLSLDKVMLQDVLQKK